MIDMHAYRMLDGKIVFKQAQKCMKVEAMHDEKFKIHGWIDKNY